MPSKACPSSTPRSIGCNRQSRYLTASSCMLSNKDRLCIYTKRHRTTADEHQFISVIHLLTTFLPIVRLHIDLHTKNLHSVSCQLTAASQPDTDMRSALGYRAAHSYSNAEDTVLVMQDVCDNILPPTAPLSIKEHIRYGLVARICRSHAVPTRPGFNSPCRNYLFAPLCPSRVAKVWCC
jgi:hypothetical protein